MATTTKLDLVGLAQKYAKPLIHAGEKINISSKPDHSTLNRGQQKGLQAILRYTDCTPVEGFDDVGHISEQMLSIEGFAGSGKSYLMTRAIWEVAYQKPYWRIAIATPSWEAMAVARAMSPFRDTHQIEYITYASLVGLRPVEREEWHTNVDGKREKTIVQDFVPKGRPRIDEFDCLILDESSMLEKGLFEAFLSYEKPMIWLGDPAQIPAPTKGTTVLSPVFLKENRKNGTIKRVRLSQAMRQTEGSAILELATSLRENAVIDPGYLNQFTDHDCVISIKGEDYEDELGDLIDELFSADNSGDHRMLAYTNRTVNFLNGAVREVVYGEDLDIVVEGEKIRLKAPYQLPTGDPKKPETIYTNNSELLILGITRDVLRVPEYNRDFGILRLKCVRNHDGKEAEVVIMENDVQLTAYKRLLSQVYQEYKAQPYPMNQGTLNVWRRLRFQTIADYQYTPALTVHRSQGSTYSVVIVDLDDINSLARRDPLTHQALLYVAVSRAKHMVIFLT